MTAISCYYPLTIIEGLLSTQNLSVMCSSELESSMLMHNISWLSYLFILFLTILLEYPFFLFFKFLKNKKDKIWDVRDLIKSSLILTIALNLATHPLVIWFFSFLSEKLSLNVLHYVAGAEAFAYLVEILLLRFVYRFSWKGSILASTLANTWSWTFGVWCQTKGWF